MEEYLSILRSAQLFSGVTEAELLSMLTCLDAKTESYPKGSFLLSSRRQDRVCRTYFIRNGTDYSGRHLGQSEYPVQGRSRPDLCSRFRLCPGSRAECECRGRGACKGDVSERKENPDRLLLSLCPPQSGHPKPPGRIGGQQPAYQRKTHPHVPAHHPRQAHVLSVRHVPARRQLRIDIPFSRQQLADYLAVERSGLSLELGKCGMRGWWEFRKNHFRLRI